MNSSTLNSRFVRATLLASMVSVAACSGGASSSPSPTTPAAGDTPAPNASAPSTASAAPASAVPTAQPSPDTIALKAYFLLFADSDESPGALVPVNREVEGTVAVARAAMEQLLAGPTFDERAHDLRVGTIGTQIPEGTRLLGIDIEGGVATVDLSSEFASGDILGDEREAWAFRLAQVTFTLTQFPTVESVRFIVDGKPATAIEGHEGTPIELATRDAYADQRPGIFVDQPAWGGELTDPLTVSGLVQTDAEPPEFHAALVNRTTDEILVQETVRATCPTGCWQPPGGGEFEFRLAVPAGADRDDLMLRVWEVSADGSEVGVLQYPLS
jgi:spore germination protein GerM